MPSGLRTNENAGRLNKGDTRIADPLRTQWLDRKHQPKPAEGLLSFLLVSVKDYPPLAPLIKSQGQCRAEPNIDKKAQRFRRLFWFSLTWEVLVLPRCRHKTSITEDSRRDRRMPCTRLRPASAKVILSQPVKRTAK